MPTIATNTDPFSLTNDRIAEQLEPFCDVDLQRFTERELLRAYDTATGWAEVLPVANTAALNIAAEWDARHRQSLPRVRSQAGYVPRHQTEVDDIWSGLERAHKPQSRRRRLETYINFTTDTSPFPLP